MYVVKIHEAKINRNWKLKRSIAELVIVLSLTRPIKKRHWTTEMVIIRTKLYKKYFLERTGFSYPPFLRNEPYGDIPHSCEAKCITFKVLRIFDIGRKSSDVPDRNSKIKRTV
jgi:hypothetical protein